LVIDTVVCLALAKWETVSGRFGGYLIDARIDRLVKRLLHLKEATARAGLGQLIRSSKKDGRETERPDPPPRCFDSLA
jgi:hypothetical protein